MVMLLSSVVVAPADALPSVDALELGGCFTDAGGAGCEQVGVATATADVVVSPDGRHVYAAGGPNIQGFARGVGGALTRLTAPGGCATVTDTSGCATTGYDTGDVTDLTMSTDGATLYAASTSGIVILSRDVVTGDLTPKGCMGSAQNCTVLTPTVGASGLAVSPDDTSVYSRSLNTVMAFERNTSTGLLTQISDSCRAESLMPRCGDDAGLEGLSYQLAVSPDGATVYVPSADGVAVLERNPDTKRVVQSVPGPRGGCVTVDGWSTEAGECESLGDAGPALANASAVAVTPSGRHVVVSAAEGAVVFARDSADGTLQMTDCVSQEELEGCLHRPGVGGIGLSISPSGDSVVLPSAGGYQWFALDDDAGTLAPMPGRQGCWSGTGQEGCLALPAYSGSFSQSAWSPDGTSVYTAGGSLAHLRVDRPPVCAPISASTTYDRAVTVPVACTDPNGDAVSAAIVSEPASGSASVGADGITYLPAPGVTGTITFTYAATASGVTSAPAQASVTVASPVPLTGVPPSTPPTTPPVAPPVTSPTGPSGGTPPATDTHVSIGIATSRVALTGLGRGKVVLSCPATEASGPCRGQVKLKTREKFPFGGRNNLALLAAKRYTIAAGASTSVRLSLGRKALLLVQKRPAARRIWIQVSVLDSAGNRAVPLKKAKLLLP